MGLNDYMDEVRHVTNMTEAHNYRERYEIYCDTCKKWFNRTVKHVCKGDSDGRIQKEVL